MLLLLILLVLLLFIVYNWYVKFEFIGNCEVLGVTYKLSYLCMGNKIFLLLVKLEYNWFVSSLLLIETIELA